MIDTSGAGWLALLAAFRSEPVRNRLMLALAYGAALRNTAQPATLWTWSKVVRRVAVAAGVPRGDGAHPRVAGRHARRGAWSCRVSAATPRAVPAAAAPRWTAPVMRPRLRVVVRTEELAAISELGVANLRRLKTSDLTAPRWRAITRLLRPLDAVNAGPDSPPTPHRRRAMLDTVAWLLVRCARPEAGRLRTVLAGWGCQLGRDDDALLPLTAASLMLANRSPHLRDMTTDLFDRVREQRLLGGARLNTVHALQRAVAQFGFCTAPALRTGRHAARSTGGAEVWQQWADRWHDTSFQRWWRSFERAGFTYRSPGSPRGSPAG